jgi:hypothetical protein
MEEAGVHLAAHAVAGAAGKHIVLRNKCVYLIFLLLSNLPTYLFLFICLFF